MKEFLIYLAPLANRPLGDELEDLTVLLWVGGPVEIREHLRDDILQRPASLVRLCLELDDSRTPLGIAATAGRLDEELGTLDLVISIVLFESAFLDVNLRCLEEAPEHLVQDAVDRRRSARGHCHLIASPNVPDSTIANAGLNSRDSAACSRRPPPAGFATLAISTASLPNWLVELNEARDSTKNQA